MAQTVNVNFKLDPDVKRKMEEVCSEIGLSMSTAFTIFAKKVGNERKIPFELTADPFYSERHMERLTRIIDGIENGSRPVVEHDLIEVDDE